ncbi:hypothetical protein [Aeromonas veronii]|uniref:hypothetical protein n=1 Tax=Aeromonas veronii TaxID=654 RepID=UPI0011C04084|nr:hypothetical protein [Aeromonas veronii]
MATAGADDPVRAAPAGPVPTAGPPAADELHTQGGHCQESRAHASKLVVVLIVPLWHPLTLFTVQQVKNMTEEQLLGIFSKALKDAFGKGAGEFKVDVKSLPETGDFGIAYIHGEKNFYLLFPHIGGDLSDLAHKDMQLLLLDIARYLTVELNRFVVPNQDSPTFWDGVTSFNFKAFIRF